MTALTIQDVSRRSGLSEPTLRYYEEIGLIGPIARDASSGHRRYQDEDLDVLQALACMRALGVGIEDMRVYQANRSRGHEAAAERTMTTTPRARFGLADVRDVADVHRRAMAAPEAAGKRFLAVADGPTISYLEIAQTLRRRLGPLAATVPTEEAPGEDLPRPIIHNDRARDELGWRPRPTETTIVETAESLRDLGLLDDNADGS